jgi:tetratricopeptide (TPR) repeat protein
MVSDTLRKAHQETLIAGWQSVETTPEEGQRRAEAVLRASPADAEAALLLAAAERRQGKVANARARLAPLMAESTRSPMAWFEWGMILIETAEDAAAADALKRAVSLEPGFTGAWRALGDQLVALGRGEDAGHAYASAARAGINDPKLAEPVAALTENRAAAAETMLRAHVQQSPGDLRAMWLLAEAAMRVGRPREAEAALTHCLELAPGFAEARHSLAIFSYLQGRFGNAAAQFKQLLDMLPHQPALRNLLAVCLREIGDYEGTLKIYEEMLARCPTRHTTLLALGHVLKALGREAAAARAYRACLPLAPGWSPSLYLSLADLKTVKLDDADLAAMRRPSPTISAFGQAQLDYAIGHVLDQRADYEGAFKAFAKGAARRRQTITYDAAVTSAFVRSAKDVFTEAFFAARSTAGCPSAAPIFIVGLPRAGSTLVEQILASHSRVEATSELKDIGLIAAALQADQPAVVLPEVIGKLSHHTLSALGARYVAGTAQFRSRGRDFFIDKMPANVLHLGLIHLILPNAKIIDVRRAPMAAGFAAFRQFFQLDQTGADFTYDLQDIGCYYRDYVELTAHFDAVLPGRVFRLEHESLVEDTPGQVRDLLEYCGLAFEEGCLRFWETERPIQTPSAQQVRRPISRSGLDHWRHYEPWLGSLRQSLGLAG